jgi:NitT/TauT family transport system ATP-binding protein
MDTNQVLLQLEHITHYYGKGEKRFVAVKDVNLTLTEGEFVVLLGPSGCGKSTLLRIVTGLQRSTEGQVIYRGKPLQGVNPHSAIVFQSFALFPWLNVQQNVEVALKARGVGLDERRHRALELLDRVGLDGFESAYPRELSGGMRQKVGFARAMAVEPELLCLDEPFSALDVLSAEALRGELMELWVAGSIPTKLILMVTHNIEEAVFVGDRIIVMDKQPGRVVSDFKVTLPHPRARKDSKFLEVVDQVYAILAGQTQPEHIEMGTAPGEPGHTRALPHVTVNEITGLVEHMFEAPGDRHDIYQLAANLHIGSDHLLSLIEAAELLSFATVSEGDITITPLGHTFADASILTRKEILATRIRRLPLFRWLLAMLTAADNRQMEWDVVHAALELDFPAEEAERQLDSVINWGRYAELFAYDEDAGRFYFEQEDSVAAI